MRKIAAVLVFAVVMGLTGAALAVTLTVTDGSVTLMPLDRVANFSGDVFSVSLSSANGAPTTDAFGIGGSIFSITIPLGDVNGGASVYVGGSSCLNGNSSIDCGSITLTSPALPTQPADWPLTLDYIVTAPFTATGHLNVGAGFDFVGQGTLTGVSCSIFTDCISHFTSGLNPNLLYTFTVDEPPTPLLVVASFGSLGALFGARVLRDRRHRRRLLASP